MGGGSVEGGISHPLFIPSSSLSGCDPFHKLFPGLHQGESSSRRGFVSHRERGGRASSFLFGLLQQHVRRLEGVGLVETYNRPVPLEQLCSSNKVQDGDHAVWRGNWMVSTDLKDAYLQVPVHPEG